MPYYYSQETQDTRMPYRRRVRFLLCSCSIFLTLTTVFLLYITSMFTPTSHNYSVPTTTRVPDRIHRTDTSTGCEIIDVSILVRGQSSSSDAALLLKSLLLFRQNPIRLHFLVDPTARHILSTLMRTWHLYGIEYNFYHIDSMSKDPTKHTDSLFNLMDILPVSVIKVISLNSTVLLSADIYQLWKTFGDMQKRGSVLGLPVTGSSAEEMEFRSDVMLIDLKTMREMRSSGLWKEALSSSRKDHNSDSYMYSDVFKALRFVYKQEQALIYPLHSGWRSHSDGSKLRKASLPCYKQQMVCAHSSLGNGDFKKIIQEYNGDLLREKWIDCQSGPTFDKDARDYRAKTSVYAPPCTDFKREGRQERRTHPFYDGHFTDPNLPLINKVTLVLHMTLDRLIPMLEPTCRHWEGPMSIAVFANDSEVSGLLDLIHSSSVISFRRNIAYHIVYKEGMNIYYPANQVRLVAMENAGTMHAFLNDVDFLSSFGLHSLLKGTIEEFDLSHSVLVVPAFETYEDPKTFHFPQNKSALLQMVSENTVFQFHRDKYIRGHAPTDYSRWAKAVEMYEIQWQPQYEPYLVATKNITSLDIRFVGRHFNKVSHVEKLYYQRYKFYVVADGFILHLPHTLSSDAKKENDRHRECYMRRRDEWRAEMVQEYGYEPYLVNLYKIWNKLSSSYDTSF